MIAETDAEFMSRLDRDSIYRTAALNNAVNRAAQDGGVDGVIDVLVLAETYYNWLRGEEDLSEKPTLESFKKKG